MLAKNRGSMHDDTKHKATCMQKTMAACATCCFGKNSNKERFQTHGVHAAKPGT
jgi:hypothetical protein